MSEDGSGVTLPKGFMGIAGAIVVVLVGAWFLIGAQGKITELTAEVANLEVEVEELSEISAQLDELDQRMDTAALQLTELQTIRRDLIQAICEVTGGPQCQGFG